MSYDRELRCYVNVPEPLRYSREFDYYEAEEVRQEIRRWKFDPCGFSFEGKAICDGLREIYEEDEC
jgi:hypothetical protein